MYDLDFVMPCRNNQYCKLYNVTSWQMYLRTELISPSCFSPKTKQQEVSIEKNMNNATIWKLECADPAFRFENEGTCVKAHVPLLIRHIQTNELLCCTDSLVLYVTLLFALMCKKE